MSAAPSAGPFASFSARLSVAQFLAAGRALLVLTKIHFAAGCPFYFFNLFQGKEVMKQIKKIKQAAWRWQVVVTVRWQRFQSRVSGLYYRRVSAPARFWAACGCPEAYRPRLPWWHQFVLAWLRISGWRR